MARGMAQGMARGMAQGMAQGLEKGMEEGEARMKSKINLSRAQKHMYFEEMRESANSPFIYKTCPLQILT